MSFRDRETKIDLRRNQESGNERKRTKKKQNLEAAVSPYLFSSLKPVSVGRSCIIIEAHKPLPHAMGENGLGKSRKQ